LTCIPVPGLPELLLSSTNLRVIDLSCIRINLFFSPQAMVTALSALTRLDILCILLAGEPDRLHLDWKSQHSPLPPRAILPSLTVLKFKAFSKYLEDFMARVDPPLLGHLDIAFVCSHGASDVEQDREIDTSQLARLISCIPKFQAPDKAHIGMDTYASNSKFWIKFSWPKPISSTVRLEVYRPYAEQHMSRVAQFCRSPFFPLPTLEDLYICGGRHSSICPRGYTRWLELFQPFTAVKNLYLSELYAERITPVLRDFVGERTMEVLPALEKVFIEFSPWSRVSGPIRKAFGQFAAARQLSGHPIVISSWDGKQGIAEQ
jgi:hypothetical protein